MTIKERVQTIKMHSEELQRGHGMNNLQQELLQTIEHAAIALEYTLEEESE